MKIGVIGLGNMAKAILGGMFAKGIVTKEDVIGSAATQATIDKVREQYGIAVTLDNREVAKKADVLLLAVKPQFMADVIEQIREDVTEEMLVITIAAGKTIAWYEQSFGKKIKLVRCMPNTPAMVGEGCTAVCRNDHVTEEDMKYAMTLMNSFGRASEIREGLMDAFCAVSGSSPAYVFLFIEAMADAGVAAGLPRKDAYAFASQAVLGSAKMVLETGMHPGELKDMVCSPAGTTIQAVKVLEEKGFRGAVMDAIDACVERAKKI